MEIINSQFIDSTGKAVNKDDILFDGKIHWRYCVSELNGTYLLSCERGYIHELTQDSFSNLSIIGTLKGNEHLLECD